MWILNLALARDLTLHPDVPVDAAIVPGCPSEDDGRLSTCQWRRVLWAHHLYASGLTRNLIVSGNAAYNPYTEATALRAGLEALGVPPEAIHDEPTALHTDENIAYSITLAERLGFRTLAVASDAGQASGGCQMVKEWSDLPCIPATLSFPWVRARLAMGVPEVRTEPEEGWITLAEREARIAAATGRKPRPSSFVVYVTHSLQALVGTSHPPPAPPATY